MTARLRTTCPTCGGRWPDGKDPAAVGDIYALRIADLLAGLIEGGSMLSPHFHRPEECGPEVAVGRWQDLRAAAQHIERAQELLAACPAITGLAEWVYANGYEYPDPEGLGMVTRARCGPHLLQLRDGMVEIVEGEE